MAQFSRIRNIDVFCDFNLFNVVRVVSKNFEVTNFAVLHKSAKAAKINTLANFLLHGMVRPYVGHPRAAPYTLYSSRT